MLPHASLNPYSCLNESEAAIGISLRQPAGISAFETTKSYYDDANQRLISKTTTDNGPLTSSGRLVFTARANGPASVAEVVQVTSTDRVLPRSVQDPLLQLTRDKSMSSHGSHVETNSTSYFNGPGFDS
jgi:hypothetical protein